MSLTEKVTVLKSSWESEVMICCRAGVVVVSVHLEEEACDGQTLGSVERVGHAHLPVHHMELQGEPDLDYVNESPACQ